MSLQKVLFGTPPAPAQDALDIALLQSGIRLEKGNLEILANVLRLGASLGQQFEALKQEERVLQKELTIKKHQIEIMTVLSKEKRSAHVESARTSMIVIAKNIATLLQTFRNFKTQFPKETIAQISDSEIPNNDWIKSMESQVTEHLKKYPLSFEDPAMQAVPVADVTLVPANHNSQVARVVEKDRSLQENVANMKGESQVIEENILKLQGELQVLSEKEQRIKKYEIQAIESWNAIFTSYAKKALLFQEKVRAFLQQQNAIVVSLTQESNKLRLTFMRDPKYLLHCPNPVQVCQREMMIPGEIEATLNKIDKTPSLLEKIDLLVPLFVGIVFKENDEVKR